MTIFSNYKSYYAMKLMMRSLSMVQHVSMEALWVPAGRTPAVWTPYEGPSVTAQSQGCSTFWFFIFYPVEKVTTLRFVKTVC